MLLFFSVARSATAGQAERASDTAQGVAPQAMNIEIAAAAPTPGLPSDVLVDISPQALRMSSPFNTGYWLSAA